MASIRMRPRKNRSPLFTVLWRDPDTHKQSGMGWESAQEAENFRRLIEANGGHLDPALALMDAVARRKPTIDVILEEHIAGLPSVTERSRADYRRDARLHISPHIGRTPVDTLSPSGIKDWLRLLSDTDMSDKTIANVHGLLSSAVATAMAAGYRDDNPCRGIRLPRRSEHSAVEMVFLTPAEWNVLDGEIAKQAGGYCATLFRALAGTGMRWGEASALQVSDLSVDTSPPTLRISRATRRDENSAAYVGPTKTRRSRRTISLPPKLAAELAEHVNGKAMTERIFTSPTGNPIHHSNVRTRVWMPAVKGAQDVNAYGPLALTDSPRIHDLRHSHASWLIAAGVDLLTVQRRLGHESITTTSDRYGHLGPQQQLAAAAAVALAMG